MDEIKKIRGEVTTQQIVFLIILVTSFVVILFFIFKLNLGSESQKDICHNSVVLKGKAIIKSGNLNCRTNYLCISGGDKCEGINPTQTVKVNLNNKDEIVKAITNEMADCWWMFGRGKVNYLGIGDKSPLGVNTCAICSIVKFDKKIQEKYPQGISYKDFVEKGLTKPRNNQESYLRYIYGVSNPDELYNKFKVIKKDVDSKKTISFKGEYMIRTGFVTGALWGEIGSNKIIYPYFFNVNNIPDPQCQSFITKA